MQNLYGMFVGATHANGVCATAAVAGKWKMNVFDRGDMLGEWSILLLLCARFLPMCLCLSVCLSQVGVLSKRLNESGCFGMGASFRLSYSVL